MEDPADNALLENLRKGNKAAFDFVYQNFFPAIDRHIRQNSGSREDAEDVFQEAMLAFHARIQEPDFILTASLQTFFFAIAKNIWLKKLRDKQRSVTGSHSGMELQEDGGGGEETEQRVTGWLQKITAHCQRILKAIFYFNEPLNSLMHAMGWRNKHTASNQKYKCLEQLRREAQNKRAKGG